jgi:hypothetical protein
MSSYVAFLGSEMTAVSRLFRGGDRVARGERGSAGADRRGDSLR